jgi:hypothetical protein
LRWSQEAIDAGIRSLFPVEWTRGVPMPCLEDLVNSGCFTAFADWVENLGLTVEETAAPSLAVVESRQKVAAAVGVQLGVHDSKHAIGSLVGEAECSASHFAEATRLAAAGVFPSASRITVETDLRFAAAVTISNARNIKQFREKTFGALKELSQRCTPLSKALRKFQCDSVRSVAGGIHVGLIAALVVLMKWPDKMLAQRFVTGFRVIGSLERSGIFPPKDDVAKTTKEDVLRDAASRMRAWGKSGPRAGVEADFLVEAALKDAAKGFGTDLMGESDLDAAFGKGRWAPTPAFVITQASGKMRSIADARRGGQNDATASSEQVVLCDASHPALCARLLCQEAEDAGYSLAGDNHVIVSGGEDMPDAYRHVPADPRDYDVNIVGVHHPERGWLFQVLWGLLFGHASSVYSFIRWSRFLEAVSRRIGALLLTKF